MIELYVDAYNDGDVDRAMSLCADDCRFVRPVTGEIDKAAFETQMREMLAAYPARRLRILASAIGDGCEFAEVELTGGPTNVSGAVVFRVDGDVRHLAAVVLRPAARRLHRSQPVIGGSGREASRNVPPARAVSEAECVRVEAEERSSCGGEDGGGDPGVLGHDADVSDGAGRGRGCRGWRSCRGGRRRGRRR